MDTLAISEDPDEMPHKASFHQGLNLICLDKTIFMDRIASSFIET